jgi:hypothetical protein
VYDLVGGQEMLQWSPLSYSPSSGARFYGIGNEYAGVILGASVIGGAALLSPRDRAGFCQRSVLAVALAAAAVLTGLPPFGANLGMSLAFMAAVVVLVLYLWRNRLGAPEVVGALLVGAFLVGAALVFALVVHGTETSHIGRLASAVKEQGWHIVGQTCLRKASMNWLLVQRSAWTDAAVAALGVLLIAVLARPKRLQAALSGRSWFVPSLVACIVGSATALLVNDSGILAAALALLYGAGSLAYVGLGEAA